MEYKLRVDTGDVDVQKLFDYLKGISPEYCYANEGGLNNPHVHFYLKTLIKEATVRHNLRKFGLKGNSSYSLKQLTSNPYEYIAYMMKDGDFHSNISSDLLKQATEYNEKVKDEIKVKKEKRLPVWKQIYNMIDVDNFNKYALMEAIINYHMDNDLLIRRHQIVCYYNTILMKLRYKDSSYIYSYFEPNEFDKTFLK